MTQTLLVDALTHIALPGRQDIFPNRMATSAGKSYEGGGVLGRFDLAAVLGWYGDVRDREAVKAAVGTALRKGGARVVGAEFVEPSKAPGIDMLVSNMHVRDGAVHHVPMVLGETRVADGRVERVGDGVTTKRVPFAEALAQMEAM